MSATFADLISIKVACQERHQLLAQIAKLDDYITFLKTGKSPTEEELEHRAERTSHDIELAMSPLNALIEAARPPAPEPESVPGAAHEYTATPEELERYCDYPQWQRLTFRGMYIDAIGRPSFSESLAQQQDAAVAARHGVRDFEDESLDAVYAPVAERFGITVRDVRFHISLPSHRVDIWVAVNESRTAASLAPLPYPEAVAKKIEREKRRAAREACGFRPRARKKETKSAEVSA